MARPSDRVNRAGTLGAWTRLTRPCTVNALRGTMGPFALGFPLFVAVAQTDLGRASTGDFDGDGLLDMVVGTTSRIDWYPKQLCP